MKVRFHYDIIGFRLSETKKIKKVISRIINDSGNKPGIADVIFTSDEKILEISKEFLSHDYYTDIITFDYSEGKLINGEIYISVERVRKNSESLGVSLKSEANRVIFHGFLHLCGYNDKTEKDKKEMRDVEDVYLALYEAE